MAFFLTFVIFNLLSLSFYDVTMYEGSLNLERSFRKLVKREIVKRRTVKRKRTPAKPKPKKKAPPKPKKKAPSKPRIEKKKPTI